MSKIVYTTSVTVTAGRDGKAASDDNLLNLSLAMPKALGGSGEATNPEQLFAAGYAACFASSLQFVAARRSLSLDRLTVLAEVRLIQTEQGFTIGVDLTPRAAAAIPQSLVDEAHSVCAYSNALRGGARVEIRRAV